MSLVLLCLTVTTLVCLLYKHVTLRKSKMAPNVQNGVYYSYSIMVIGTQYKTQIKPIYKT